MVARKPNESHSLSIPGQHKDLLPQAEESKTKIARPHFETSKIDSKPKTHLIVKCNCGFPNNLYIRGEGVPGLSWTKGVLMKNIKADEWHFEIDLPFTSGFIKVLVNDKWYEKGDNHKIECGKTVTFTPSF